MAMKCEKMRCFSSNDLQQTESNDIVVLYHGSTYEVSNPEFGVGRSDNDYGSGFYTTRIRSKAVSWAQNMGNPNSSVLNSYKLDLSQLNICNLDDYGVLAWIAEIAFNRRIKSELADEFLPEFIKRYKIDTSNFDVIIGYRADDSYTDVIAAFCDGLINCDEVQRLFYKGNLGEQYFIKSEKAFNLLQFIISEDVCTETNDDEKYAESNARAEVHKFIMERRTAIAKRFSVPAITIIDAISNNYNYNKEYKLYEVV